MSESSNESRAALRVTDKMEPCLQLTLELDLLITWPISAYAVYISICEFCGSSQGSSRVIVDPGHKV